MTTTTITTPVLKRPKAVGKPAPREPGASAAPPVLAAGGTAEFVLPHDSAAPAAARHVARALLTAHGVSDEIVDGALLVASELVTNAVEHALPPLTLHLRPEHAGGRIWIGVTDGGPAPHEGPWPSGCTEDEHGRGLLIVDMLAITHGNHTHPDGRATHWARITTR
ncbi:ATP-binding protein [Streptomyces cinereoruber]|uniref:ATP-binding protein n=1 Tax=Streptomyces cinereoruber TaxID=67260 RepID=UPI003628D8B0